MPDAQGPPKRRLEDKAAPTIESMERLGTVLVYWLTAILNGWLLCGWLLVFIIFVLWLSVEERLSMFLWMTPKVLAWTISAILVVSLFVMALLTVQRVRAPRLPNVGETI